MQEKAGITPDPSSRGSGGARGRGRGGGRGNGRGRGAKSTVTFGSSTEVAAPIIRCYNSDKEDSAEFNRWLSQQGGPNSVAVHAQPIDLPVPLEKLSLARCFSDGELDTSTNSSSPDVTDNEADQSASIQVEEVDADKGYLHGDCDSYHQRCAVIDPLSTHEPQSDSSTDEVTSDMIQGDFGEALSSVEAVFVTAAPSMPEQGGTVASPALLTVDEHVALPITSPLAEQPTFASPLAPGFTTPPGCSPFATPTGTGNSGGLSDWMRGWGTSSAKKGDGKKTMMENLLLGISEAAKQQRQHKELKKRMTGVPVLGLVVRLLASSIDALNFILAGRSSLEAALIPIALYYVVLPRIKPATTGAIKSLIDRLKQGLYKVFGDSIERVRHTLVSLLTTGFH